jgi:hypothetical protein
MTEISTIIQKTCNQSKWSIRLKFEAFKEETATWVIHVADNRCVVGERDTMPKEV